MAENLRFLRMTRVVVSSHRFLAEKISYRRIPISSYFTDFVNQVNSTSTTNFSFVFKECGKQGALELGKQAHAHMIISGFRPTTFVLNCLMRVYTNSRDLVSASMVFDRMPLRDVVSWNTMIKGYSKSNDMVKASSFFNMMPVRDVVSWNSMLSGCLQNGESWKCIEIFVDMGRAGISFDGRTFAIVLKVCSFLEETNLGMQIHGVIVRVGCNTDVVAASALLDMYAKCKRFDESLRVFQGIPEKNSVSWSAIIAGCVQNNLLSLALKFFKEMQKGAGGVSQSIYASVLRSCAALSELRLGGQLHAHALKSNFAADGIVRTATLDMYAKCDNMQDAQILFDKSENLIRQSYNAMITGYSQEEHGFKALLLFHRLMSSGLGFDEISLSGVFRACALVKGLSEGLQIYGLAIKSNLSLNVCVANAAIDMYGKCQALSEAFCVFNEMRTRDAVSWNAIIAAHEQNGRGCETLSLFVSMLRSRVEPDEFTFGSVLKACTGGSLGYGMEIHSSVVKSGMASNSSVGCSLIDMYSKCGMIEEAEKIHSRLFLQGNVLGTMEELEKMHNKRLQEMCVSWNSIISGYVTKEQSEDAQVLFTRMMEMGITPDKFTYATVLDTCANLASAGLGKQIHAQVIKKEMQSDVYICSTLVDMYSKCGDLHDSRLMFEKSLKRDFVTWNAMISGYAHHGKGEEAIKLFERMILGNIKPNHVTFISILRACAHMGLIDKGLEYFYMMKRDYGLDPQLPHYSNMVDILGKSGKVKKALKLIGEMPFEADDVIWRTLLGVCAIHRNNVEIAEEATAALLRLDPQDSSAYTLLSNVYADAGMWEKVSDLRRSMRGFKLKKEPGCSWVELKEELHVFLVGDKAHPRWEEIYNELDLIYSEMRLFGDCSLVPEVEVVEHDLETWDIFVFS
ncbi:Pentatricopeptide repeat-containing protein [Cardamine amara subsp. amara]|uniref:Pentatricopeptide repeat-containing protein n=1 Tax=Cardamine amara subsp. amara TaxID=228776 RepID=A0ABD1AXC4_CARAN